MMPPAGYIKEQLAQQIAMMAAPWVVPQYCWATAWGLWLLNYQIALEAMTATTQAASKRAEARGFVP